MEALQAYITSEYKTADISFSDRKWHIEAEIPNTAGWYFIKTDTPIAVLQKQKLWQTQYIQPRNRKTAKVKNYNLSERANRYTKEQSQYWNIIEVYSGLASNLQQRAKDHTFADPGTGSLALSQYPELAQYTWTFHYITLSEFYQGPSEPILSLGEQMWRSINGWPILCAE